MRASLRFASLIATLIVVCLLIPSPTAVAATPQRIGNYQEAKAMLAVIGNDGNVSVYDANGQNPIQITHDAEANKRIYQWPTWSTDGRLAFFGASVDPADSYTLRMFVVEQVTANPKVLTAYSSGDEVFTYAYWSPGDCGTGSGGGGSSDCRDMALLFTPADGSGLAVRLIRDRGGSFTDKLIGQASPFYYSFAPDGKSMLWTRFGRQIEVYDVAGDKSRKLGDKIGQFNAPMWSPVDNRLLFGVANTNPELTDVVIGDGADRRVLLRAQEGPVSFAWSPDASLIASVAAFDKVIITDVKTGKTVATGTQNSVVAHFWAPGSDRVAYLVVNRDGPSAQTRLRVNGHTPAEQATGGLTWYVLDVKSGKSDAVATFSPTRDMVYLLNFFDQFARSHSLWSPDGRYLTYGAIDSAGKPGVYMVDTLKSASPTKVGAGSLGIWSWH